MIPNKYNLLLHPAYLVSLFILIVNDIFLKYAYPSFFTGKISDLSGFFCFTIFLFICFLDNVSTKKAVRWSIALASISISMVQIPWLVKSSNNLLRNIGLSETNLTPDITDLCVLVFIPAIIFFLHSLTSYKPSKKYLAMRMYTPLLLIVSSVWFVATSFYSMQLVTVNEEYNLKKPAGFTLLKIEEFFKEEDFLIQGREALNDSSFVYSLQRKVSMKMSDSTSYSRNLSWSVELLLKEKKGTIKLKEIRMFAHNIKITETLSDSLVNKDFKPAFDRYAKKHSLFVE